LKLKELEFSQSENIAPVPEILNEVKQNKSRPRSSSDLDKLKFFAQDTIDNFFTNIFSKDTK